MYHHMIYIEAYSLGTDGLRYVSHQFLISFSSVSHQFLIIFLIIHFKMMRNMMRNDEKLMIKTILFLKRQVIAKLQSPCSAVGLPLTMTLLQLVTVVGIPGFLNPLEMVGR